MDNNFDIEVVAEVEIDVENEVDIEVEIEEAGPRGKDGLSAYDIYVKNGGILTEEEWLISLKGEKGDVGDTGYTLTNTLRGESITIEDAVEFKLFNLEIEGKTIQDESVGYTNLFDIEKITNNAYLDAGSGDLGTSGVSAVSDYIKVKANETYTLSYDYETLLNTGNRDYALYDINKVHISGRGYTPSNKPILITPTQDGYIRFAYDKNCTDIKFSDGKARIEVKTVGKNLILTNENEWEQGTINDGNNENNTTRLRTKNYIEINDDTLHTFHLENAVIGNVWFYDEQKQVVNNLYDMIYQTGMKFVEFTTPKNTKYYKVVIRYEDNSVITSQEISEIKPMLEKGSVATEYEEHKSNTTLLELNEPLRSLPNGVKDRTYIKNNKLYVDRYIKNNEELTTPITEEVGDCIIYTYAGVNNIDLEAGLKTDFSVTYAQDMMSILKDYPSMEEIQAYVDSQLGTINEQLASLTEVE